MVGGYTANVAALNAAAGSLRQGAGGVSDTAASSMGVPDGGDATAVMAAMLAVVLGAGDTLAAGLLANAELADASGASYLGMDDLVGAVFGGRE